MWLRVLLFGFLIYILIGIILCSVDENFVLWEDDDDKEEFRGRRFAGHRGRGRRWGRGRGYWNRRGWGPWYGWRNFYPWYWMQRFYPMYYGSTYYYPTYYW